MIAITGAAGFIGSNLARRLLAEGDQQLLLVDRRRMCPRVANDIGWVSARTLDHVEFLEDLESDAYEVEAIFHLGACSDTTESDWDYLRRNNVQYSQRLWRWCAGRGASLVYASSAATYGDGSLGFDDETSPEHLQPLNLYGRSKNEFDRWVMEQARSEAPQPAGWAGLKFFNVYGPNEEHKKRMASMVMHAYHQACAQGEVTLFRSNDPGVPDGGQRRDFIFVEDCVGQMIWHWRHPTRCGLFNCGTGHARTFRDLVEATFAAMGRPCRIQYVEMPEDLRGRYQNFTEATTSKVRAAGYDGGTTTLEDGVRRYVAWLASHDSNDTPHRRFGRKI